MPEPFDAQPQYPQGPVPPPPPPPSSYEAAPQRQRAVADAHRAAAPPAYSRTRQLMWVALAIVDLFLVLHFIFLLSGAGDVGFGRIVYVVGDALNAPFRGLFNVGVTHGGHPIQWADIVAIVIYSVVALIIDRVIAILSAPSPRRGTAPPPS